MSTLVVTRSGKAIRMLSRLSDQIHSWTRGWVIPAIFAAFVVYVAATLPFLNSAPGGNIEPLDAQFFYTPEKAFSTVDSYGDSSPFWIIIYLTWEVAAPILYSLTFSLVISWLFRRGFQTGNKLQTGFVSQI